MTTAKLKSRITHSDGVKIEYFLSRKRCVEQETAMIGAPVEYDLNSKARPEGAFAPLRDTFRFEFDGSSGGTLI